MLETLRNTANNKKSRCKFSESAKTKECFNGAALRGKNVGLLEKFNYSVIECWHFWGRKTGNSLKAAEQPGRETPAAVKESAGPRWLWNGSLLGSGRRSRSANPGYLEAPEPPRSPVLIENNPPGTLGLELTSVQRGQTACGGREGGREKEGGRERERAFQE